MVFDEAYDLLQLSMTSIVISIGAHIWIISLTRATTQAITNMYFL